MDHKRIERHGEKRSNGSVQNDGKTIATRKRYTPRKNEGSRPEPRKNTGEDLQQNRTRKQGRKRTHDHERGSDNRKATRRIEVQIALVGSAGKHEKKSVNHHGGCHHGRNAHAGTQKITYGYGAYAENPLRRKHGGEHPCLMQAIAYAKQAQLAKRILFAVIGPQRNTRNNDSHNLLPPPSI